MPIKWISNLPSKTANETQKFERNVKLQGSTTKSKKTEWERGRMRKKLNWKETEWDWVSEKKTDWDREVGKSSKRNHEITTDHWFERETLSGCNMLYEKCNVYTIQIKKCNKKVRRFPSLSDQLNKENIGLES